MYCRQFLHRSRAPPLSLSLLSPECMKPERPYESARLRRLPSLPAPQSAHQRLRGKRKEPRLPVHRRRLASTIRCLYLRTMDPQRRRRFRALRSPRAAIPFRTILQPNPRQASAPSAEDGRRLASADCGSSRQACPDSGNPWLQDDRGPAESSKATERWRGPTY